MARVRTKIQIYQDSILIHEADTLAEACDFLGWDEKKAKKEIGRAHV